MSERFVFINALDYELGASDEDRLNYTSTFQNRFMHYKTAKFGLVTGKFTSDDYGFV